MRIELNVEIKGEANLDEENILSRFGLLKNGRVQRAVDSAVIRFAEPYVPYRTGRISNSAYERTVIGSGMVTYEAPYAGEIYNADHVNFNIEMHPLAGSHWIERMKADHLADIAYEARKALKGGPS